LTEQSQVQEGFCSVAGGQLYYQVAGAGPAVVMIHAGIADQRMWDDQVAALAPHYQVVRFDCRGFGRSRSEPVVFSNRQDVADLMDHLGIAQAALVGCSRGGMIALDFAIERPERASSLTWVCSGVSGWEPADELFVPEEIALYNEMEAAEQAGDHERTASIDVRLWVDGPRQPEGRADPAVRRKVYEMALNSYTTAMVKGLQPQPLDPPAVGRLGALRIPVLAIVGDLDSAATPAAANVLAEGAPDVRIVHFPDCAHVPNMEQPERFNQLLLEFLAAYSRVQNA
jgi:3-oxoadipate enol-lactonase